MNKSELRQMILEEMKLITEANKLQVKKQQYSDLRRTFNLLDKSYSKFSAEWPTGHPIGKLLTTAEDSLADFELSMDEIEKEIRKMQ